jgi:hypothetical protein
MLELHTSNPGLLEACHKATERIDEKARAVSSHDIFEQNPIDGRVVRHHHNSGIAHIRWDAHVDGSISLLSPSDKTLVQKDLLVTLEPLRHLVIFFLVIGRTVSILGEVYMELLCVLHRVVVGRTKQLDHFDVVTERMEFREIKVCADADL